MTMISFHVENIKCGGCSKTITKALAELGVVNVDIDIENQKVSFEEPLNLDLIPQAQNRLEQLGYPIINTLEGLEKLKSTAKSYVSCLLGKL